MAAQRVNTLAGFMVSYLPVQDIGFIIMTRKTTRKNTRLITSTACIDGCFGQNILPSFGAGSELTWRWPDIYVSFLTVVMRD